MCGDFDQPMKRSGITPAPIAVTIRCRCVALHLDRLAMLPARTVLQDPEKDLRQNFTQRLPRHLRRMRLEEKELPQARRLQPEDGPLSGLRDLAYQGPMFITRRGSN